jgi:Ca-activated chloride channel family protein
MRTNLRLFIVLGTVVAGIGSLAAQSQDGFTFKSGVELINVTATVTDRDGRFVSGLQKEDFTVLEEGRPQDVTHFSNERVPVSLGILLDASGSMTADKMSSARSAIDRFVYDLLDKDDELFFMQFANRPDLIQDWTTDRKAISRAAARVNAYGGTALYDAVADAVPIAAEGKHAKKALLVISDGNDTNSDMLVGELRQLIRQNEVMVYALGVDGTESQPSFRVGPSIQLPIPFPGGIGRRRPPVIIGGGGGGGPRGTSGSERVNAGALRQITDDTGGRTEIVRGFGDLDDATARIADELSKQYYLGYSSTEKKDGRWHDITVQVKDRKLFVRARKGYLAS